MKPITANFLHYFQNRLFWLVNLSFALFLLFLGHAAFFKEIPSYEEIFFVYLIMSLFAGAAAAWKLNNTLGKPFVCQLPGHCAIVRRLLFSIAIAMNLLCLAPFMMYPWNSFWERLLTYMAGSSFGAAVFFIGVLLILGRRITVFWLVAVQVVLFSLQILILWLVKQFQINLFEVLLSSYSTYSLITIAVCSSFCILLWFYYSPKRLSGKIRQKALWNAPDFWLQTRPGARSALTRPGFQGAVEQWLEKFFLSRMALSTPLKAGRFIWGALYSNIQLITPMSRYGKITSILTLSAPLWLILFGYLSYESEDSSFSITNITFIWPFMLGLLVRLPINSSQLIPAGRRERFKGVLSVGLGIGALGAVFGLLLIALSWSLDGHLPALLGKERVFSFQPVNPQMLFPALIAIAAWYCCQLLWPSWEMAPKISLIIGLEFALFNARWLSEAVTLPVFIMITIASWALMVALAFHFCFYRNLITRTPGDSHQRMV